MEAIREVLVRNFQKSKLMVALTEMEWRPGLCAGVARLEAGKSVSQLLYLEGGREYAFIASGGPAVTDLDLYLRRPGGQLLESDQETDPSPVVVYTPKRSGPYTLQLHLPTATVPEAIVSFNVLTTDGTDLPEARFRHVLRELDFSHRALADLEPGSGFTTAPRQWLLYGFLLDERNPVTLETLQPQRSENHVMVAAGEHLTKIDLYLQKPDGTIITGEIRDETLSLLNFHSLTDASYRLRIEARSNADQELLFLGFYQK